MGYGASSKGGGGSGNSGGGKKKAGRAKSKKPREFKVKQQQSNAIPPAPLSLAAYTVIEPDPKERKRLLASRKAGEIKSSKGTTPVNGTSKTHGRKLGTGGALTDIDNTAAEADEERKAITTNKNKTIEGVITQLHQKPHSTSSSSSSSSSARADVDREKRLIYLAHQKKKADAVSREQREAEKMKRDEPFGVQIRLTQQKLEMLALRFSSSKNNNINDNDDDKDVEFDNVRRLLAIVLKNSATKSDPKYKLLKAYSNDNIWKRLLRYPEMVAVLEEGAGFQRVNNISKIRAAEFAKKEQNRIRMLIAQALDDHNSSESSSQPPFLDLGSDNNPSAAVVASLIAELEALEVVTITNTNEEEVEDRDFELCGPSTGTTDEDKVRMERIFAVLRVVNGFDLCGG